FYEGDVKLTTPRFAAVRVSLPSDKSFESYASALAHVQGPPLPIDTEVVWNQGFFDALLVYNITSERSRFALHPYLSALAPRVVSVVHFLLPNGSVRNFALNNDPGLVRLDPRWHQSVLTFVSAGFLQVFDSMEFLLFLVCLAISVRRLTALVPLAAAFAVAHSVTLVGSAYQIAPTGAWFPPVIAALTAIAIVCMTIDNVFFADTRHQWV